MAGVLTSAFLFGLGSAFRKIVLPWYQSLVYRGIRIDGEWEIPQSGTVQHARITLVQRAFQLSGTCVFVRHEKPDDTTKVEAVRNCVLSGRISDRFVELSFRHADQSRLGAGVFLLEVVGDGRRMTGQQTFYSVMTDKVLSVPVQWRRPSSAGRDNVIDSPVERPAHDVEASREQSVRREVREGAKGDAGRP